MVIFHSYVSLPEGSWPQDISKKNSFSYVWRIKNMIPALMTLTIPPKLNNSKSNMDIFWIYLIYNTSN